MRGRRAPGASRRPHRSGAPGRSSRRRQDHQAGPYGSLWGCRAPPLGRAAAVVKLSGRVREPVGGWQPPAAGYQGGFSLLVPTGQGPRHAGGRAGRSAERTMLHLQPGQSGCSPPPAEPRAEPPWQACGPPTQGVSPRPGRRALSCRKTWTGGSRGETPARARMCQRGGCSCPRTEPGTRTGTGTSLRNCGVGSGVPHMPWVCDVYWHIQNLPLHYWALSPVGWSGPGPCSVDWGQGGGRRPILVQSSPLLVTLAAMMGVSPNHESSRYASSWRPLGPPARSAR